MVGDRGRGTRLEHTLTWLLAAMVFLFVAGSSSVPRLHDVGGRGRWLALIAVWVVSAALAVRGGRRVARSAVPVLFAVTLALPLLGLASASWSVDPRLTIGRAVSLGILLTASLLVAYACVDQPGLFNRVVDGLVAGAGTAAVAGGILIFVSHDEAIQSSFPGNAARYRGIGENPNTVAMLAAVCLPLAAYIAASPRRLSVRMAAAAAAFAFYATIVASGSRGGFVGGTIAMLIFGLLRRSPGRRLAAAAAVVVLFGGGLMLTGLLPTPPPAPVATPSQGDGGGGAGAHNGRGGAASESPLPRLEDEFGRPGNGAQAVRSLLSTSGRLQAWAGAIEQADQRPLLGYGFGTESRVFIDRFYFFQGALPENSWIGVYLQLGAIGVVLLLLTWFAAGGLAVRLVRRAVADDFVVAIVAALAAGFVLTFPQSYIYSVGNVATATVWISLGLLGALAVVQVQGRARV